MKKIFITGGFGYIGSKLAMEALCKGYSVFLYDSLIYKQNHKKILKEIESKKTKGATCQFVIGDVRDTDLLKKSLKNFKPDFLFHFAELVGIYACNNDSHTKKINYAASKKVIDIANELKIPTIYNSTSSLYGSQKNQSLLNENTPIPKPTDNYCKYKLKMEEHIKKTVAKNPDFKIIILRPATICSVAPRMRIELLPNHFTYCALSKGVIKISDPNAYRAVIDVGDIISGYLAITKKDKWPKLIYNIGHHNLSKKQFAIAIQKIAKCKIAQINNLGDVRNLKISSKNFSRDFDWKPKHSLEDTIRNIKKWFNKNLSEIEKNSYAGVINTPMKQWLKMI